MRSKNLQHFWGADVDSNEIKLAKFSFLPDNRLLVEALSSINHSGIKNVKEIAENLSPYVKPKENIIFGLSGSPCFGFSTTVKVSRDKPESKIEKGEIDNLVKKIQEISFIEASKIQGQKFLSEDNDIDILNSGIISQKVNGNFVETALESIGENMEIGLFTAYAERKTLISLSKLCSLLKMEMLGATSVLYSLAKLVVTINKNNQNFALVNCSKDRTDFAICFGGGVVSTKSINLGVAIAYQEISDRLNIPIGEAMQKISKMDEGTVDSERVKEILSSVQNILAEGVECAFENFDGVKTFPSKIFLFGNSSATKFLHKALSEKPWYENLAFKSAPEIVVERLDYKNSILEDPNDFLQNPENTGCASLGLVGSEILKK